MGSVARLGVVVLCWVAIVGCSGSAPHSAPPTTAAPDVTLGAGDTFELTVYGEKDLSGKYQVAEDGSINVPLIGRVQAGGQVPSAVARAVETALADKEILRRPSVSIYVLEYASKRFSVVGAVQKPGSFSLTTGMTVVGAISLAGGLTSLAASNQTIVTRQIDGKLERYRVSVERVTEGREHDFPLQAGDIVYVPERVF